jgi:hypothetical protein
VPKRLGSYRIELDWITQHEDIGGVLDYNVLDPVSVGERIV